MFPIHLKKSVLYNNFIIKIQDEENVSYKNAEIIFENMFKENILLVDKTKLNFEVENLEQLLFLISTFDYWILTEIPLEINYIPKQLISDNYFFLLNQYHCQSFAHNFVILIWLIRNISHDKVFHFFSELKYEILISYFLVQYINFIETFDENLYIYQIFITKIIESNNYFKLKFVTDFNSILNNVTEFEFQFAASTKNLISLKFLCKNVFSKLSWCEKYTNVCQVFQNYTTDIETLKYMKSLKFLFEENIVINCFNSIECMEFLLEQENLKFFYNLNSYYFFEMVILKTDGKIELDFLNFYNNYYTSIVHWFPNLIIQLKNFESVFYCVKNNTELLLSELFVKKFHEMILSNDEVEGLEFLHKNGYDLKNISIENMINCNSIKCFKYAVSNGLPYKNNLLDVAVYLEDLQQIILLFDKGHYSNNLAKMALFNNNLDLLEILKYGFLITPILIYNCNMIIPIINNNVKCLKYCLDNGNYLDPEILDKYMQKNKISIEMFNFLKERKIIK